MGTDSPATIGPLTDHPSALPVVETERSRGLGSRLLSTAIELAAPWTDHLHVYTDVPAWYERRGWTAVDATGGGVVLSRSLAGAR